MARSVVLLGYLDRMGDERLGLGLRQSDVTTDPVRSESPLEVMGQKAGSRSALVGLALVLALDLTWV